MMTTNRALLTRRDGLDDFFGGEDYLYGREKLGQTVHALAVGEGRLKDRLKEAYIQGLHVVSPKDHIPGELRERFAKIKDRFVREGTLDASIEAMSDAEARQIVDEILYLDTLIIEMTASETDV